MATAGKLLLAYTQGGECAIIKPPMTGKLVEKHGREYTDDGTGGQVWSVRSSIIRGYTVVSPQRGPHDEISL
jgi:hypothetical protein